MYACGLKTAFKKMVYVSQIYASRAEVLQDQADTAGRICVYGPAKEGMQEQRNAAAQLSLELSGGGIAGLSSIGVELERQNRALAEASCPELF